MFYGLSNTKIADDNPSYIRDKIITLVAINFKLS